LVFIETDHEAIQKADQLNAGRSSKKPAKLDSSVKVVIIKDEVIANIKENSKFKVLPDPPRDDIINKRLISLQGFPSSITYQEVAIDSLKNPNFCAVDQENLDGYDVIEKILVESEDTKNQNNQTVDEVNELEDDIMNYELEKEESDADPELKIEFPYEDQDREEIPEIKGNIEISPTEMDPGNPENEEVSSDAALHGFKRKLDAKDE
jgi:hypothetical protein